MPRSIFQLQDCLRILVAFAIMQRCYGCMETAWVGGRLPSSEQIAAVTLHEDSSAECACCGLCSQRPACASLAYSASTRECQLFSSVANYSMLMPDDRWRYLVMPGRSRHGRFCRHDSDCVHPDDFCRAHICTRKEVITCRTVFHMLRGISYSRSNPRMYGYINGTTFRLTCAMKKPFYGATRVLLNVKGNRFTETTVWNFNQEQYLDINMYSILNQTDEIRKSSNTSTYKLWIGYNFVSGGKQRTEELEVARDEVVVGSAPRPVPGAKQRTNDGRWQLGLPYYTTEHGPLLLSVNAGPPTTWDGSLARRDGHFGSWVGASEYISVFIRED